MFEQMRAFDEYIEWNRLIWKCGCIHLGYYSGSEFANSGNGYVGSDRVRPYGSPQPVDVPPTGYNANGYFGGAAGGGGGYGGGGGVPGGYDGGTYDPGMTGYDGNSWPDKMNVIRCFFLILISF